MIVNTKTGLLVSGSIARDPELRYVGQHNSAVLKLSVRYGTQENPEGRNQGKFLDIDLWDDAEKLDGMLLKGDSVLVVGGELKSREYGGKMYYSMRAEQLYPGAEVVFRWMQQVIDLMPATGPQPGFEVVDEPAPFVEENQLTGHELYPGEQLADHLPGAKSAEQSRLTDFVQVEPEDLPF